MSLSLAVPIRASVAPHFLVTVIAVPLVETRRRQDAALASLPGASPGRALGQPLDGCRCQSDIPQKGQSNFPHLTKQSTMFFGAHGGRDGRQRAQCWGVIDDSGSAPTGFVRLGD